MKKIIVILVVSILSFTNCEKVGTVRSAVDDIEQPPQPLEVQEFLNSDDFKKNEFLFEGYGEIGIGKVERFQIFGDSMCQLMIPLMDYCDKTIIAAYIQVIRVPENELPDKGVYFMNLIDLIDGFDNITLTGHVAMFGVNYKMGIDQEPFEHCELEVEDNIITSSQYFPLPEEYLQQASKFKFRDFLSCYRHTRQAMDNDDVLYFVCSVTEIVMPICEMASAAYCIHEQSH